MIRANFIATGLSYGVVCVILRLAVSCDRQTHRQTHDDSIHRASMKSRGKSVLILKL